MAAHPQVTFDGPWRGMELRSGAQTDKHCELGLNVDFSNGLVEGRAGIEVIQTEVPALARLHAAKSPNADERYLLCIGHNGAGDYHTAITFCACYLDGTKIDSVVDLTANFAEVPNEHWDCSFVDVVLSRVSGAPNFVTLIVTPSGTYVHEPEVDPATVRRANMDTVDDGGDVVRQNEVNSGYWTTAPKARIAVEHRKQVFYAGFARHVQFELSNQLELDQTGVHEGYIDITRGRIGASPDMFVWSDINDPLGIPNSHFDQVPDQEPITGLASFQDVLVIFTDRAIYTMAGANPHTSAVVKTVFGIGCVSHGSPQDVGGLLYFMSHDGFYVFTGAEAIKISSPLDPIFTGKYDHTHYPATIATKLTALGWPFQVSQEHLHLVKSVHNQQANQIWWSIPVQSRQANSFPVTIVWDYVQQAWSIYTWTPSFTRANQEWASPMFDGVVVQGRGGRGRLYTSSGVPELQRYGSIMDGVSAGACPLPGIGYPSEDRRSVPVIWMTSRLFRDSDTRDRMSTPRLKVQGVTKGKRFTYFLEGENAFHDIGDSDQPGRTGSALLHPDSAKTYFFGTGVFGTAVFAGEDWFSLVCDGSVRSRSMRLGFVEDYGADGGACYVRMQSFSLEVQKGDSL